MKTAAIAVVTIAIFGLLFAVAKNLGSMNDIEGPTVTPAPPHAPSVALEAWASGEAKGRELGAIAARAGLGMPTTEALDLVARNHGEKSGYSGEPRGKWERALKAGYKEGYADATKKAW